MPSPGGPDATSPFRKPVRPKPPDSGSRPEIRTPAPAAPGSKSDWAQLWSGILSNRRVAWMLVVTGILIVWLGNALGSSALPLIGVGFALFGGYIVMRTRVRTEADPMRWFGRLCIAAGITIALLTPVVVRTMNRQNFEVCLSEARRLQSTRAVSACGADDTSVMPGFVSAGIVTGFGALILAIRRPRD